MAHTLDEILALPGNRAVFDKLVEYLKNEKPIAFVGSGASAGMYPLWEELIGMLADHAVAQGKAEPKDRDRWKTDKSSTPQQRVDIIRRRLGDPLYHEFLRQKFGPRQGADGKRYTPVQAALLRLPFLSYVTTNYDPALDFARGELRPGCLSTGIPTWQDDDEVRRWLSGDIFGDHDCCPILWLHGCWQRPDGIVLNSGEYQQTYRQGLYRRTFERLWAQNHLVFAGFGFNDPRFTFMVSDILYDIKANDAVPHHIAMLALTLDNGDMPDDDEIEERRDILEADYHVRPLFYPVRGGDHIGLQILLDGAIAACGCAHTTPAPAAATAGTPATTTTTAILSRWVHESSEDDKFTGREDEIARLDRWMADSAVRAVGVCAVGGTGKTALVGHWLKNTAGWRRGRTFEGLFAWSFYRNRESREFLRAFLLWAHGTFGTPKLDGKTDLSASAHSILSTHSLVLVLDGLEVLQEGQETCRYGSFLDSLLRELLGALCQEDDCASLAVLTSRFVFADLERFLGTSFHQLELPGLLPEQGACLLHSLGVRGPSVERDEVSWRLEGHPLGLRVFAEALPENERSHPLGFLEHAFRTVDLPVGAPLNDKLKHLLAFYQEKLTSTQVYLLGVVALFRAPIASETILHLVRGLFDGQGGDPLPDDPALAAELERLAARGVLSREPLESGSGYACHPILRDHFRAWLLGSGAGAARRAADLLKGEPSAERPRSVKEIQPLLLAIELLLDAGDFEAADDLYRGRLQNGNLFKWLPAPAEGFACALGFVRDAERKKLCEEKLTSSHLGFYLIETGLFADYSGDYESALLFQSQAIDLYRRINDVISLCISLMNEADLMYKLGRLDEVRSNAAEALSLAGQVNEYEFSCSYYMCGWAAALTGQSRSAADNFVRSIELEKKCILYDEHLYTLRGTHWTELLLRSGHADLARRRTQANLAICEDYTWNEMIALCRWMLGRCALAVGELKSAGEELLRAEDVFRRGQLLFFLARLHVSAGELALARRDTTTALSRAGEALALAGPRDMRLVHADALVLRGRARLAEGKPGCAVAGLDDAEEACRIARDCGYAWGERDALSLQAEAGRTLAAEYGDSGQAGAAERSLRQAKCARSDAEAQAARLRLTEEDLAEAETKAKAWLKDWEKEKKKKVEE